MISFISEIQNRKQQMNNNKRYSLTQTTVWWSPGVGVRLKRVKSVKYGDTRRLNFGWLAHNVIYGWCITYSIVHLKYIILLTNTTPQWISLNILVQFNICYALNDQGHKNKDDTSSLLLSMRSSQSGERERQCTRETIR